MYKILLTVIVSAILLFARDYTLNLQGEEAKENISFKISFQIAEDGKIKPNQKIDVKNYLHLLFQVRFLLVFQVLKDI